MTIEQDYFCIAIYEFYRHHLSNDDGAFSEGEVSSFIQLNYFGSAINSPQIDRSSSYISSSLGRLVSDGLIIYLPDNFGGDFYAPQCSTSDFLTYLNNQIKPFSTYLQLGNAASRWLSTALRKIEEYAEANEAIETKSSDDPIEEDRWEPLPLELNAPEAVEALEHLEQTINAIKADNGFSSEYPVERDNLVHSAHATLAAAKGGMVGKGQIRHNIVSAGKWLMDKFGGSALGALGGELVKWGLRIIGLL